MQLRSTYGTTATPDLLSEIEAGNIAKRQKLRKSKENSTAAQKKAKQAAEEENK